MTDGTPTAEAEQPAQVGELQTPRDSMAPHPSFKWPRKYRWLHHLVELWRDLRHEPKFFSEPANEEDDINESEEDPDNWKSLDYVHDQIGEQFEHQSALWDALDGRLRLVLGVIGIAFAAGLSFRAPNGPAGTTAWFPLPLGVVAALAVVLYMMAAAIVARVYIPTAFDWPPKPANLRTDFLLIDPRETKLSVIDTMVKAYQANELVIGWKTRWFVRAFGMTTLATFLLGIAVIGNIAWQTQVP